MAQIAVNDTFMTELRDVTCHDFLWDHTMLPLARSKWTRPTIISAQVSTRLTSTLGAVLALMRYISWRFTYLLTYPDGWVDSVLVTYRYGLPAPVMLTRPEHSRPRPTDQRQGQTLSRPRPQSQGQGHPIMQRITIKSNEILFCFQVLL